MRIPYLFKQTIFISFAISLLLMPGCNKRNKPADMKITDPEPDISMRSIYSRYVYNPKNSTCSFSLTPSDSSVSQTLDIDKDGTDDFSIDSQHHAIPAGQGCNHYDMSIIIRSLHSKAEISSQNPAGIDIATGFMYGIEISKKSDWRSSSYISLLDTKYIGLRIDKHYGWIKLNEIPNYLNGVVIHKYGISGVRNKTIKAGEGDIL